MGNNKGIWAKDDCGCGKPAIRKNDPRRKRIDIKKTIKRKIILK